MGPASFIVTASDIQPVYAGNVIIKFAGDTYIIVPAVNSNTATSEISQVQSWAEENNLMLNCEKSKDIIFTGCGTQWQFPRHAWASTRYIVSQHLVLYCIE